MRLVLAAFAGLALLLPATSFADDAIGVVESVDYDTGMIFLSDGQHFIAEDSLHIEELRVGEAVKVAYEAAGEDRFATGFEIVRAEPETLPTAARRR